jgi:predicted RNase H-like HicB family nuclease
MSTYTVFFEPTATSYSTHVPDLRGCVAAAGTLEETRELMREAIEFYIEGMRVNGDTVPEPTASCRTNRSLGIMHVRECADCSSKRRNLV